MGAYVVATQNAIAERLHRFAKQRSMLSQPYRLHDI
jgi:hypothetical protein